MSKYKKKTKPAIWLSVAGALPIRIVKTWKPSPHKFWDKGTMNVAKRSKALWTKVFPEKAEAKAVKQANAIIRRAWRSSVAPYLAGMEVKGRDNYVKLLLASCKPRKRIRPVSKSRQKRNAAYVKLARAYVAAAIDYGGTCPVVRVVPELRDGWKYGHRISAKLNEVHHTRGRAGALLTDTRYFLAVSKQGHRWIHEHPDRARALGFLCAKGQWNENPSKTALK